MERINETIRKIFNISINSGNNKQIIVHPSRAQAGLNENYVSINQENPVISNLERATMDLDIESTSFEGAGRRPPFP